MAMVLALLALGTFLDGIATESNTLEGVHGDLVNTVFDQEVTRLNQPTAGDASQGAVLDAEIAAGGVDLSVFTKLKTALMIDFSFFEGNLQIVRWFLLVIFVPVYLLWLLEIAKITGSIVRGLFSLGGAFAGG
jgi:hypothetical protein